MSVRKEVLRLGTTKKSLDTSVFEKLVIENKLSALCNLEQVCEIIIQIWFEISAIRNRLIPLSFQQSFQQSHH